MLQVRNLKYTIGRGRGKFTVQNVNFSLEPGYLMCLLGKNGSGKSTLLRLLYGIMPADEGSIQWSGKEVYDYTGLLRREIAYVGDEPMFFENMAIKENMEAFQLLYPDFSRKKWSYYLKRFELENVEEAFYEELSTGQKRQVQLAFVLARKPQLLLLDEPTANLDPVFRVEFMELLQQLVAKEKISVILSTHILDDVEEIADYIGIMSEGEMILFGDREKILEQQNGSLYKIDEKWKKENGT